MQLFFCMARRGLPTRGCGDLNLRPLGLPSLRACSIGCNRRVSIVQKSSSPFGSATPEDVLTAVTEQRLVSDKLALP